MVLADPNGVSMELLFWKISRNVDE